MDDARAEFVASHGDLVRKAKGRWGTTHYELKSRTGNYQKVGQITSDSPEGVLEQLYDRLNPKVMATVYTKGGYYYLGPDSLVDAKKAALEDIESGTGEYEVSQVYISPLGDDGMPNADADPVWMWSRSVAESMPLKKKHKSKSRSDSPPTTLGRMR